MIYVDQTIFGWPTGNCMAACVASLLEMPIDDVPALATPYWFDRLNVWGKGEGFRPVVKLKAPRGWAIACGMGPRGWRHAVVVKDGVFVHDPHPDRAGLVSVDHYVVLQQDRTWSWQQQGLQRVPENY